MIRQRSPGMGEGPMDSSRREEGQGGRVERVCLGVALDVGDPCGDWEESGRPDRTRD